MNDIPAVNPATALPKFGDVLMLSDTPVLAGVIMALAQPFAELHETTGLPPWTPLLVAALASLLVAVYHVQYRRKTHGPEAWLVTPLVAMILFSGAIGANNVVDAARKGSGSRVEQASAAVQELKQLQAEYQLLRSQLDSERRLNEVLRSAVGAGAKPKLSGVAPLRDAAPSLALRRMRDFLFAPAHAQTTDEATATLDPRVTEALRVYELEQAKLQEQRTKLRQQEEQKAEQQDQSRDQAPLWKTW